MDVNMTSMTVLTKQFLSQMASRRSGVVVNISSFSGLQPTPLLAQYSAAKAYVDVLSQALDYEYQSFGVRVQCVAPLFVTSKLSKIRKASLFTPSPATFARAAVAKIGYETLSCGYWAHDLQAYIVSCVPAWLYKNRSMAMHLSLRHRALKKKRNA